MTGNGERTRVDDFRDDILAAPDELAAVLDRHGRAIAALPPDALDRPRWRFVGMGSSRFAALDVATALRAAGMDAATERPSASAASPPGEDTLLVAISNSGRTTEVLAAADRHRGVSFVLGLTSRPESPLATRSDALLPLVGRRAETSGIASLSFRSTVAALSMLAGAAVPGLARNGIGAAVPALERVVRERGSWLPDATDRLDTGRPVHVLGDGSRIGGVEQTALMLREAPRIEATAYDTGDWLHAGLYTVFPGDTVLLFTGSAADDEVIATIRARGCRIVSVGARVDGTDVHVPLPDAVLEAPEIRALVEPVIGELLAAELWRRTSAQSIGDTDRD